MPGLLAPLRPRLSAGSLWCFTCSAPVIYLSACRASLLACTVVNTPFKTLPRPSLFLVAAGPHVVRDRAREVCAGRHQGRRLCVSGVLRQRQRRSARARGGCAGCGCRGPGAPGDATAVALRLLRCHLHQPRYAARPCGRRQAQAAGALEQTFAKQRYAFNVQVVRHAYLA